MKEFSYDTNPVEALWEVRDRAILNRNNKSERVILTGKSGNLRFVRTVQRVGENIEFNQYFITLRGKITHTNIFIPEEDGRYS